MTTKFVQSPIPSCQLKGAKLITRILKQGRTAKDAHFVFSNVSFRLRKHPFRFRSLSSIKASKDNSADVYNQETELSDRSIPEMKAKLYQTLQGINRGIFGVQSAKKSEIESLVEQLESQNPTPYPTEHLQEVNGSWKLIYSTISILGVKRTKLGLREFITLGDFYQVIDVHEGKAVNVIKFGARGIMSLEGQLSIEASFEISSKTRVNIKYRNSTIIPKQLMNLFEKNYNLLLAIFNPDGWLEISYLDKSMRIGRDDKGNMFILERYKEESLKD